MRKNTTFPAGTSAFSNDKGRGAKVSCSSFRSGPGKEVTEKAVDVAPSLPPTTISSGYSMTGSAGAVVNFTCNAEIDGGGGNSSFHLINLPF